MHALLANSESKFIYLGRNRSIKFSCRGEGTEPRRNFFRFLLFLLNFPLIIILSRSSSNQICIKARSPIWTSARSPKYSSQEPQLAPGPEPQKYLPGARWGSGAPVWTALIYSITIYQNFGVRGGDTP